MSFYKKCKIFIQLLFLHTCINNTFAIRKKTLYQDNNFNVVDLFTETEIFRLLTPRISHFPNLAHGFLSLDNPTHIQQDYFQMIMGALFLEPAPKRILLVGLGIGVLPRTFTKLVNDCFIDVVEIDPNVLEIAKKYFFFGIISQNKSLHR